MVLLYTQSHTLITRSSLPSLSLLLPRSRWKKYLLHFSVVFAVLFNLPKWFEMCVVETAGGKHVMSTR